MGWDTPTYPQMDGMERNGRIENVCVCMQLMCVCMWGCSLLFSPISEILLPPSD